MWTDSDMFFVRICVDFLAFFFLSQVDSLFACMYRTMMLVHIYVLILIHSGESKVLYWQNKLKTVNLQINGQARYMKLRENIRGRGKEKE